MLQVDSQTWCVHTKMHRLYRKINLGLKILIYIVYSLVVYQFYFLVLELIYIKYLDLNPFTPVSEMGSSISEFGHIHCCK